MNVLIQDFFNNTAERELSERIKRACKNLGWNTQFAGETNVNDSTPDFALALHHLNPRTFDIPTFGCLWNPPDFFQDQREKIENLLSYDGFLFGSALIRDWFDDIVFSVHPKKFETGYILPTVHNFVLSSEAPKLHDKIVYCGTNWQKGSHHDLLTHLDRNSLVTFIGPSGSWSGKKNVLTKAIPFDGESIIRELSGFAAGLCLTSEYHRKWEIPSMRVFETITAGSLPICDQNPFFKEAFPEALFITEKASVKVQVEEIGNHLRWIKENPNLVHEKVRLLQTRLQSKFTLEKLLEPIAEKVQAVKKSKFFVLEQMPQKTLQVILIYGSQNPNFLNKSLESIAGQTFKNIEVLPICTQENQESERILESYRGRISMQSRSKVTSLWSGLSQISADYFAVLNEGDRWARNHIALMVDALEQDSQAGVAHCGLVDPERVKNEHGFVNYGGIDGFESLPAGSPLSIRHAVPMSGFVARASLLTERELQDPKLEDSAIFYLLLLLSQKSVFKLVPEATLTSARTKSERAEVFTKNSLDRIQRRLYGYTAPVLTPYSAIQENLVPSTVLDNEIYGFGLKMKVAARLLRITGIPQLIRLLQRFLKEKGLYYKLVRSPRQH